MRADVAHVLLPTSDSRTAHQGSVCLQVGLGFNVVSIWFQFGFNLVSGASGVPSWFRVGFRLVSIWFQFGFNICGGVNVVLAWFRFGCKSGLFGFSCVLLDRVVFFGFVVCIVAIFWFPELLFLVKLLCLLVNVVSYFGFC